MIFSVNIPNKTIKLHRDDCEYIKSSLNGVNLEEYPDGYCTSTSGKDKQFYFDEKNFSLEKVRKLFKYDFATIFCRCFEK